MTIDCQKVHDNPGTVFLSGIKKTSHFCSIAHTLLHSTRRIGLVRRNYLTIAVSPDAHPALVLNADYRPLSYYPLSLWSWQDAIKAVFLDRVNIVSEYEAAVHSPTFEMKLPSVVVLKTYIRPNRYPAFTRFNVFLRDKFECQYCASPSELTFDHVVPRSKGGRTSMGKCLRGLFSLQFAQGQQIAQAGKHVAAAKTVHADHRGPAPQRAQIPAQPSA